MIGWWKKRRERRSGGRQAQPAARRSTTSLAVSIRRGDNKRRGARRVRGLLVWGVALAISGLSIWRAVGWLQQKMATDNAAYTLKKVTVEVIGKIRKDEVLQWAKVPVGANLYRVNLMEIQGRLQAKHHVKEVSVEKVFPDAIHIRVEERRPVARVVTDRDEKEPSPAVYTVDEEGMIMRARPGENLSRLPEIRGVRWESAREGQKVNDHEIFSAINLLSQIEVSPVKVEFGQLIVDISKPTILQMVTRTGGRIRFHADSSRHAEQLDRLQKIYYQAGRLKREILTVDLTVAVNVPVTFVKEEI